MSKGHVKALVMDKIIRLLQNISDEENEIDDADVVVSPDSHYLTNEDEANDNETGKPIINDVPDRILQTTKLKVMLHCCKWDLHKVQESKKKNSKICVGIEHLWRRHSEYTKTFSRTETYSEAFRKIKDPLQYCTSLEIFQQINTQKIYDYIAKESNKYSTFSTNHFDILSVDEQKTFFSVMIFFSYCKLPATRNY